MKVDDSQNMVVYYLYRYINSNTVTGNSSVVTKDVITLEYANGTYVVVDNLKIVGQTTKARIKYDNSEINNNTNSGSNMGQTNSQQTPINNVQATNSNKSDAFVGGFSQSNTNNLDSIQTQANNYVLASVPKLATWNLINTRTQNVSGQNNCFTYQNPVDQKTEEYCVWSQPWNNNFMQLTLPDGTKLVSGGSV